MKFFIGPHLQWELEVQDSGVSILERLENQLEPMSSFRLVAKLSDGGIVTRTLASPKTERTIFGHRSGNRIHFAITNYGMVSSPFQPICRCELVTSADAQILKISSKPHRQAMALFPFYAITAFALFAIALFCVVNGLWVQSASCGLIALALIGVPYFRMLQGFKTDNEQLLRFLEDQGLKCDSRSRSVAQ